MAIPTNHWWPIITKHCKTSSYTVLLPVSTRVIIGKYQTSSTQCGYKGNHNSIVARSGRASPTRASHPIKPITCPMGHPKWLT